MGQYIAATDNGVRIDDDTTTFGSLPRNQPFIVQVSLDIDASAIVVKRKSG